MLTEKGQSEMTDTFTTFDRLPTDAGESGPQSETRVFFTPMRILVACVLMGLVFASPTILDRLSRDTTTPEIGQPQGLLSIDQRISLWGAKAESNPTDAVSRSLLAEAWLASAHRSGSAADYEAARNAATESLEIVPGYAPSVRALAGVELAAHRFEQAIDLASEVLTEDPADTAARALRIDASLELGALDAAKTDLAALSELDPGPAITIRNARYRALIGDNAQALALAERAEQEAISLDRGAEVVASYQVQRAVLAFEAGDVATAIELGEQALALDPDTPLVIATAARMAAADGDLERAAELYARVAELLPNTTWLAAQGDVLTQLGRTAEAADAYRLVETLGVLGQVDGLAGERAFSRYLVDHGLRADEAIAIAEAELAARPDVHSHDTVAWAALATGDLERAGRAIETALATGIDHPVIHYHAGMIAKAAGDDEVAASHLVRALELNPVFDPIHADLAADALDEVR